MSAPRRMSAPWAAVMLITLLAFALRVYHLDALSFWSDEGISVLRARVDLPTLFATLPVEHTPLYFVALHFWMHLAGESDFAVRYLSLMAGVIAVPLVYRLGLHAAPDARAARVGLVAALLAAINPLQVWYAQEARMYTLVVALCAGAAWALLRAMRSPSARGAWLAFALLMAAALYTHFFAALIVAALALWALWAVARDGADWRPFAAAFGLSALLFLPWLPRAIAALSFPGWQTAADPLSLPARYLVAYTLGSTASDEWRWLALGFLLLLIVGGAALLRQRTALGWLPLFYVGVPFVLLMLLALRKPGYHERYLIVITPFVFVLLAAGINALHPRWHVHTFQRFNLYALAALLFVLGTSALSLRNLYFEPQYGKPDFRAAAQYVDQHSRAGDGLIFDGPDPHKAFYRYFSRARVAAFDGQDFDAQDVVESSAFLAAHAPQHERWWVVLYFHPPGPTEDWLLQRGFLAASRWFNGIRVLLYATPSESALRTYTPESVETQLPLQIASVRALPRVQPGDVLPVIVRWQVNGPLPADYQISLRLLNSAGAVVKQLDRRPLDGRVPTSQWSVGATLEDRYGLLVPDDAPSGAYQVQLILYPLQREAVLRAHLLGATVE